MFNTCISHPESHRLIIVRDWQLYFCATFKSNRKGESVLNLDNTAAAALMSYFEFWHNKRIADVDAKIRMAKIQKKVYVPQQSDYFQFHSQDDLVNGLMGIAKKDAIIEAKKLLIQRGAISEHSNPDKRFQYDRKIHYLFHNDFVNYWIKNIYQTEEYPIWVKKYTLSENRQCASTSSENRHTSSENRQCPLSENRQSLIDIDNTVDKRESKEKKSLSFSKSQNLFSDSQKEEKEKSCAKKESESNEKQPNLAENLAEYEEILEEEPNPAKKENERLMAQIKADSSAKEAHVPLSFPVNATERFRTACKVYIEIEQEAEGARRNFGAKGAQRWIDSVQIFVNEVMQHKIFADNRIEVYNFMASVIEEANTSKNHWNISKVLVMDKLKTYIQTKNQPTDENGNAVFKKFANVQSALQSVKDGFNYADGGGGGAF